MHQLAHHGADDQFLCLASSTEPLAEALAPGRPVHGHHGGHVQGFAQEAVADLRHAWLATYAGARLVLARVESRKRHGLLGAVEAFRIGVVG
ncbi:hypothetical protein D3C87_1356660 [compost metagenome]